MSIHQTHSSFKSLYAKFSRKAKNKLSTAARSPLECLEHRTMLNSDEFTFDTGTCVCGNCSLGRNPNAHPGLSDPTWVLEGERVSYEINPNAGAFGESGGGSYATPSSRWGATASQPTGTATNGANVILTYSFVPDGTNIPGYNGEPAAPSDLFARMRTIYAAFGANDAERDAFWQNLFHLALNSWGTQAGIVYNRELADDGVTLAGSNTAGILGVRGDVRIGGHFIDGAGIPGQGSVLAYNFFPSGGADMVIDTSTAETFFSSSGFSNNNSRRLRNVVAHEAGHGLGFNHTDPINQTKLMEASTSSNPPFDGPQFDDRLVANFRYGDLLETPARNNTPATATPLGSLPLGATTRNNLSISIDTSSASTSDVDHFSFTIPEQSTLRITAQPLGSTYLSGAQGSGGTSFNALATQNLVVSVFQSNGTTLIQSSNTTSAGVSEVLSNLTLPAGTYQVQISSSTNVSSNAAQMYNLSIDRAAPLAATVTNISPDPRTAALSSATVTFNNPINPGTFDVDDIQLLLDGQNVILAGVTVNAGANSATINGLAGITSRLGTYELIIPGSATIVSTQNGSLVTGDSDTWLMTGLISSASAETLALSVAGPTLNVTTATESYSTPLAALPSITVTGQFDDTLAVTGSLATPVTLVGLGNIDLIATSAGSNYSLLPGTITGDVNLDFTGLFPLVSVVGDIGNDAVTLSSSPAYTFNFSDAAGGQNTLALASTSYALSPADVSVVNLSIDVDATSSLALSDTVQLDELSLASGALASLAAGPNRVLGARSISIQPGGVLNTADWDVVVNYAGPSPKSDLRLATTDGRIVSTDTLSGFSTLLALFDNATYGFTEFSGIPADTDTIIGKFTYAGDANLDGEVNSFDYATIDDQFANPGDGYTNGDLNFDDVVDSFDYSVIDDAFGAGVGSPLRPAGIFSSTPIEEESDENLLASSLLESLLS